MTLETRTCLVVVCDGCGEEMDNGEGFVPHFGDAGAAQDHAEADDGVVTDGDRHYCANCVRAGKAPADVVAADAARWDGMQRDLEALAAQELSA